MSEFLNSCSNGDIKKVKEITKNCVIELREGAKLACLAGNYDIVSHLIDIDERDTDMLFGISRWDDEEVFCDEEPILVIQRFFIQRTIYNAAKGGNLDIVKLLIERGHGLCYSTLKFAYDGAIAGNHVHILEYIILNHGSYWHYEDYDEGYDKIEDMKPSENTQMILNKRMPKTKL